jgi:hypothetical protein
MLAFWAFQSARYEVKKDKWNDVAIEIYYHKDHQFNLDRMMSSVKESLEEFSTRFGPYQFKQFRILEFPRYSQFAQAFRTRSRLGEHRLHPAGGDQQRRHRHAVLRDVARDGPPVVVPPGGGRLRPGRHGAVGGARQTTRRSC